MSTTEQQEVKKASEQDVDNVINWLVSEFENIDQSTITTKGAMIVEAGTRLIALGLKPKGIAAELGKNAKALHVARSWIYEQCPIEWKRAERSAAISKGINDAMSTKRTSENQSNDDANEHKNDDQTYSEGQGETVESIVGQLRDKAKPDGNHYIVPKDLMDKLFSMVAPKVAA